MIHFFQQPKDDSIRLTLVYVGRASTLCMQKIKGILHLSTEGKHKNQPCSLYSIRRRVIRLQITIH